MPTSVGVQTPGTIGTPCSSAKSTTAGAKPGVTMKPAPAASAASACARVTTVPAPTRMSGTDLAIASIAWAAEAVRKVISAQGSPASTRARASGTASSTCGISTTGMTRKAAMNDSKSRPDASPSPVPSEITETLPFS